MEISYLGHSSFKIKGKTTTVVTDPFLQKCEADIVTISHHHSDHDQIKLVAGSPYIIDGPGEYEVKGVSVIGVASWHDDQSGAKRGANTIYVVEIDGLRVCHLGDLGHKLADTQLEELGSIDIVLVPVGGEYTIDAKAAAEVAKQVDPWIVIPMHYQQPGLDATMFGKLAGVDAFLKEMGKDVAPIPRLIISRDKLPQESQIVVLERK